MRSHSFNSSQGHLNPSGHEATEYASATKLPVSSGLLDLGNHAYLSELFPMAAFAVRAPDGVIAWFNSRAAKLLGRVPKIGDTAERFCEAYTLYYAEGTYMGHCDTPAALALKTGDSVHEEEVVIERPDGSRVTVSVHIDPIREKDGRIIGVVNCFQDITERKQAERSIRLLAAIVSSTDDGIISKKLDGTITTWNKGAERLFGYLAEEAIGRPITMIIPPDRLDEEATILEALERGERIEHFETVRVRKDGEKLDISLTISPLKDDAGRVIGASKIARDITQRKQVERALRESEDRYRNLANELEIQVRARTNELEQRNEEVLQQSQQLRELSMRLLRTQDEERRRIARDLHDSAGQIVTVLGLNLTNINQHIQRNGEIGKLIEESHDLVHQLSKEIRTLSYLLHPPLLDENGLSGAIHLYIEGLTERNGLKIEFIIPQDFGRLQDDMEVAIFRIVQECLTNIHRHSGSKTATIRLSRNVQSVFLEIADEGIGIPEEKLAAIRTQRSGVGISGIRERVRNLRGVMTIQANANGTTISITFPLPTTATSTSDPDTNGQRAKTAQSSN